MLTKYKPTRIINTRLFEKDYLDLLDTVFSSAAQPPENATTADPSAGAAYIKEQLDYTQMQQSGQPKWRGAHHRKEEDEDEADPEWVDFDPKKEGGNFFGRSINDEKEIREQVTKEKEMGKTQWNNRGGRTYGGSGGHNDEDEFDKLVRQQQEEESHKRAAAALLNEKEVAAKVAELESSQRNYSDIDLIYEKKRAGAQRGTQASGEDNVNDE